MPRAPRGGAKRLFVEAQPVGFLLLLAPFFFLDEAIGAPLRGSVPPPATEEATAAASGGDTVAASASGAGTKKQLKKEPTTTTPLLHKAARVTTDQRPAGLASEPGPAPTPPPARQPGPTTPPAAIAPAFQPDAGLELWKTQVEANVREELARETRYINQLMDKQSVSDARQARLEKALRMLIAHYKTSQARAHQGEVKLHELSVWAHKAHDEMADMEAKLVGHDLQQGKQIEKLWGQTAQGFETLSAAGDEASAQLDAAVSQDAAAAASAQQALGNNTDSGAVVSFLTSSPPDKDNY